MAAIVLLSALAIPISSSAKAKAEAEEGKPKIQRLTNLLRVPKIPTREALLKDAVRYLT